MMKSALQCYGDALSQYRRAVLGQQGHFSIAESGFYNYPYLFGYLFSLGLYAQHAGRGEFVPAYRALLRDTGRMSAEALVEKHLGSTSATRVLAGEPALCGRGGGAPRAAGVMPARDGGGSGHLDFTTGQARP